MPLGRLLFIEERSTFGTPRELREDSSIRLHRAASSCLAQSRRQSRSCIGGALDSHPATHAAARATSEGSWRRTRFNGFRVVQEAGDPVAIESSKVPDVSGHLDKQRAANQAARSW